MQPHKILYGAVVKEYVKNLHRSPADGEGGLFFSLSLPVVHNQLLCFANIEMEVVVPAPRCQGSDLLSVGHLIIAGDQADDGRVVSKIDDGVGVVCGHVVMRERGVQERTEHAALRCACVESQGGGYGAA